MKVRNKNGQIDLFLNDILRIRAVWFLYPCDEVGRETSVQLLSLTKNFSG